MNEITFAQQARASIWQFRTQCSDEEFESLSKEVREFCNDNKELPVSEQKRLFDEKYGHLTGGTGSELTIKALRAINSKLSFFVILTIISIVFVAIVAIGGALAL
jgi:hypothetical protein